jgi:hypothetical protein
LLTRHRILVRDATSFGLSRHIRVAARSAQEHERLRVALARELHRGGTSLAALPNTTAEHLLETRRL